MRTPSLLIATAVAAMVLAGCGGGNVFSLEPGDCFEEGDFANQESISDVPLVECSEAHDFEVFATFDLADGDFPGTTAVQEQSDEGCIDRFDEYVGIDYQQSRYFQTSLYPTSESWDNGDREIVCVLFDPDADSLTGSVQGAAE